MGLIESKRPLRKQLLNFDDEALNKLSEADRTKFVTFGQGAICEIPYTRIHHAFEAQAREHPDAVAVRHLDQDITYGELNRRAEVLAQVLVRNGVSPGDHVGLFVQRSIPMVVGILGTLKVGAVYVPQDARVTPTQQLRYVISKAHTQVILTLSDLRHLIPQSNGQICIDIDQLAEDEPGHFSTSIGKSRMTCEKGVEDLCFVLFTSGTTGKPNGVKVTHANVCNLVLSSPGDLGIEPGRVVAQIMNVAFDMAAWEIFGCLAHGGTLLIRGKEIAKAVAQADVIVATPSILSSLDPEKCRHVRTVAVAGEPCPNSLADSWSEFATFYNACGPTEVTIVNTMHSYTQADQKISIGRPIPNTTVYILDENLEPCSIGEIGEMWAGGACVSRGYVANSRLTNERYKPDPFLGNGQLMFQTRDLGRWNDRGELEHFGRTDDQVKVRGFRVELDSVSAALESMPEVRQAVTLQLDSRNLVAFVTPASVNPEAAKRTVGNLLPYYCMPLFVVATDELPKTNRGKTDKKTLTVKAVKMQESHQRQLETMGVVRHELR